MKEQILVFFSTLYRDGTILDYTQGGEVEIDIDEGGCITTDDLLLEAPSTDNWYGLWIWEGNIGINRLNSDLEYIGGWRRLTPEEIVLLVKGLRVVDDIVLQEVQVCN